MIMTKHEFYDEVVGLIKAEEDVDDNTKARYISELYNFVKHANKDLMPYIYEIIVHKIDNYNYASIIDVIDRLISQDLLTVEPVVDEDSVYLGFLRELKFREGKIYYGNKEPVNIYDKIKDGAVYSKDVVFILFLEAIASIMDYSDLAYKLLCNNRSLIVEALNNSTCCLDFKGINEYLYEPDLLCVYSDNSKALIAEDKTLFLSTYELRMLRHEVPEDVFDRVARCAMFLNGYRLSEDGNTFVAIDIEKSDDMVLWVE